MGGDGEASSDSQPRKFAHHFKKQVDETKRKTVLELNHPHGHPIKDKHKIPKTEDEKLRDEPPADKKGIGAEV